MRSLVAIDEANREPDAMKAIDRPFTKIINGTMQFVISVFQRRSQKGSLLLLDGAPLAGIDPERMVDGGVIRLPVRNMTGRIIGVFRSDKSNWPPHIHFARNQEVVDG